MLQKDRYALFGNPVEHSPSPFIHNTFAEQTQQTMQYEKILAPLNGFVAAIKDFQQQGGKGGNITVPFKQECFALANELTLRAKVAGAVNTYKFLPSGAMLGDNTDGLGLVRDLSHNLKFNLQGKHILLIGAGGAARGALKPLLDEQPKQLSITNRTFNKALALAEEFSQFGNIQAQDFATLNELCFDLIINATSSSLHKQDLPLPTTSILNANSCCYDMVYSKNPSLFMRWAAMQQAKIITDGLGMLVEQAAEAFFIFRQVRPKTHYVYQHLRQQLH